MAETENMDLPELFWAADGKSAKAQSLHFNLIRIEYALLVSTAVLAWLSETYQIASGYFGLSFVALVAIATISHFQKADAEWYQARALAESVKTATWLFVMRAKPFSTTSNEAEDERLFLNSLSGIVRNGGSAAFENLDPNSDAVQITDSMKLLRASSWEERLAFYVKHRILDQRKWYATKAKSNRDRERLWYIFVCGIYSFPLALIVFGALNVGSEWALISIFLLTGSGLLGWTKSKRYRELATSYSFTAREIDLLSENAKHIESDTAFKKFVETGELVFSREHTQWYARQLSTG